MEGFEQLTESKGPSYSLPKEFHGQRIALKFTGGVGDVVIAIGSTARALSAHDCTVAAFVMDRQKDLMMEMLGVDVVKSITQLNKTQVRNSYDHIIDFAFTFNRPRQLLAEDYYSLVEKKVGIPIRELGKFLDIEWTPPLSGPKIVAIHPGASNPNRRWSKWEELAKEILSRNLQICWLGTSDEYGFNCEGSRKLSDTSSDLLWQVRRLAESSYFIGNDSGFAHLSGIMGIPGTVLFSVTHPKDVIARYPLTMGVSAFERLGVEPSRSFRPDDPSGIKCMEAITVDDVLKAAYLNDIRSDTSFVFQKGGSMKAPIAIVGSQKISDLAEWLADQFEVTVCKNVPSDGTLYKAIIIETEDNGYLIRMGRKQAHVDATNFEHVKRALRELGVS